MQQINPVLDPNTVIDFYAGSDKSYHTLLPLWDALKERQGTFFASPRVSQNGVKLEKTINIEGDLPVIISSYKDLSDIFISAHERPFIMYEMEHNTETRGLLNIVSLFLCRNMRTFQFRKGYATKDVYLFGDINHAAKIILDFCKGKEVKHITEINGRSVGLVYMAWGDKALKAIKKSLATLRFLGYSYPVAIVGDFEQDENWARGHGCNIVCSTNPFDATKQRNFQFRAGRVKPQLCHLTPFDLNLYLDADTKFIQPIHSAFEQLTFGNYDLMVTEEKLSLIDLYNKKLAGWEINLLEREQTIKEIGNPEQKFINSGVIFFRKNDKTLRLFSDWHLEWMRFQEWDEQLALMRAIHNNKDLKVKRLSVDWNSPQLTEHSIIYHNYGNGEVRVNA